MQPQYSLIIPAYNEQDQLARTLPLIREAIAQVGQPGELIVVDNNSTDDTAAVAREHNARVVFEPVNQIAKARNAGAAAATTDALIFVDADTTPDTALLCQAVALLLEEQAIGGGATVCMGPDAPRLARLALFIWNRVSHLFRLPAGCFFFCRRDAFHEAGGFPESVYASEEVWLGRRLRKLGRQRGMPMTILPDPPVLTSARKTDKPLRVAAMMMLLFAFPFAVRWRRLCGYWYKRPSEGPTVDPIGARSVSD